MPFTRSFEAGEFSLLTFPFSRFRFAIPFSRGIPNGAYFGCKVRIGAALASLQSLTLSDFWAGDVNLTPGLS